MRRPKLDDIISDIYEHMDNVETEDTDFGDSANTNVEIPVITDLAGTVSYYNSSLTRTPYARITWTWTRPPMHDEDGGIINPLDPLILDDINFDPVTDYMFGTAISGGTPTSYASTAGLTSTITENHALGADITGSVYAVLKSGIIGPKMNYTTVVTKDTTAPGQPSAPTLVSTASIVTATYDGLLNGGGAQPSDYNYTEILAGTVNPPTTKVGEARGRGLYSFYATAGTTVYVQLFSYDTSLNRSVGSPVVSTVVKSVLDDTGLVAALDNKKVIYAQNTDPAGNVGVTLHDGDWWFVTDTTISTKITTMKIRTGGAWVTDTIHAATVIAAQSIVAGQLDVDAVVASNIKAGEIYSKLSTTKELKADVISAGIMNAAITISGLFQTAAIGSDRVVMDSTGITLFRHNTVTGNDDIVVSIPVVGDAQFFGMLNATGLTVLGLMSLKSMGNSIEPGANLILNTKVTAPTTGPSGSAVWDSVQCVDGTGASFTTWSGCSYGTGFLTLLYNTSTLERYINQNNADGSFVRNVSLNSSTGSVGDGGNEILGGIYYLWLTGNAITAFGGYIYGLLFDNFIQTDGNIKIYIGKWIWNGGASDGTWVAYYPVNTTTNLINSYSLAGLTNDGTNLYIAYTHYTNYKLYVKKITTAGVLVSTAISTTSLGVDEVRGFAIGTFDFGGASYYAVVNDGLVKFINVTTNVITPDFEFPLVTTSTYALGYDASGFYTLNRTAKIQRHNGPTWIASFGPSSMTIPAVATYYDSVGTTYEGSASPPTNILVKKRAKIQLSMPGWVSDTSTVDSVNQLKFYLKISGTYYPQGSTSTGTLIIGTIISTGSQPPVASTFPGAVPGFIGNPSGSLKISGDGTIRSKLMQSVMIKSGSVALTANALTQLGSWTLSDNTAPVTFDLVNGVITTTEDGYWDVNFFGRWPYFGSAFTRLIAILADGVVVGNPEAQGGANWAYMTARVIGMYFPAATDFTFMAMTTTNASFNTATMTNPTLTMPMSNVTVRRV